MFDDVSNNRGLSLLIYWVREEEITQSVRVQGGREGVRCKRKATDIANNCSCFLSSSLAAVCRLAACQWNSMQENYKNTWNRQIIFLDKHMLCSLLTFVISQLLIHQIHLLPNRLREVKFCLANGLDMLCHVAYYLASATIIIDLDHWLCYFITQIGIYSLCRACLHLHVFDSCGSNLHFLNIFFSSPLDSANRGWSSGCRGWSSCDQLLFDQE